MIIVAHDHECDTAIKTCRECLRAWLNRPTPERLEELAAAGDPPVEPHADEQLEAGHA